MRRYNSPLPSSPQVAEPSASRASDTLFKSMGNELPKLAARVSCTELTFAAAGAPSSREASAAVALSDTELLLFGGGSGGECVHRAAATAVCAPR